MELLVGPNQTTNTNRREVNASMDGDIWRPTQGADPAAASAGVNSSAAAPAGDDWRAQFGPVGRSRVVNKMNNNRFVVVHPPMELLVGPNQTTNTNRREVNASMDGANWRPTQGADPAAASAGVNPNAAAPAPAGGDWRAQLQPEARSRIVNKIMETLKKHLPVSVPEGLNELQKIAVRFEEKIYTSATSQTDYLRKISLKMLSMEASNPRGPQPPGNAQVIPNQNPSGPGTMVEAYDPSKDPRRRAKSKDPAWKYGFRPDLERKNLLQCTLCNKRVLAGVGRLKRHLAGGHRDVEKCPKATAEIRKEMHDYLKKNSRKFKAMAVDEEDEAEEGEGAEEEVQRSSGVAAKRKQSMASFTVAGPPQKCAKSVVDKIGRHSSSSG